MADPTEKAMSASATFQLRRRTAAGLPERGHRPCEEENADPATSWQDERRYWDDGWKLVRTYRAYVHLSICSTSCPG